MGAKTAENKGVSRPVLLSIDPDDTKLWKKICQDLFGSHKLQLKGLVDCNASCFDTVLNQIIETGPPHFASYFRSHIEADMKEGMLPEVREAAGLGEELFYNNALEFGILSSTSLHFCTLERPVAWFVVKIG